MGASLSNLNLPNLNVQLDLSAAETRKTAANVAGLASGLLPGLPLATAGQFAAQMWEASVDEEISWNLIRKRYGDLVYREMHPEYNPKIEGPVTQEMVARLDEDQMRATIETSPMLEGVRAVVKQLDDKRSGMFSRIGLPIAGGLVGTMVAGPFGFVPGLIGGGLGAWGGTHVDKKLRDDKNEERTDALTMYESLVPFMQVAVTQGGGIDTAQDFAMAVVTSKDAGYRDDIEKKLGKTLEEALDEHNALRAKGEGQSSKLYEIASNPYGNADLTTYCNCDYTNYDLNQPISAQRASRINSGLLDPRTLVLGDALPPLGILQSPSLNLGSDDPQVGSGHGLPPMRRDFGVSV